MHLAFNNFGNDYFFLTDLGSDASRPLLSEGGDDEGSATEFPEQPENPDLVHVPLPDSSFRRPNSEKAPSVILP